MGIGIFILAPICCLIIELRDEVVLFIAGIEYLAATNPLTILVLTLFFSSGASFLGQCLLIPLKKENKVLKISVTCAVVNLILNIYLIPYWGIIAAAFTTFVFELISFILSYIYTRKYIMVHSFINDILKSLAGVIVMIIVFECFSKIHMNWLIRSFVIGIVSLISYCVAEIVLKNESIVELKR